MCYTNSRMITVAFSISCIHWPSLSVIPLSLENITLLLYSWEAAGGSYSSYLCLSSELCAWVWDYDYIGYIPVAAWLGGAVNGGESGHVLGWATSTILFHFLRSWTGLFSNQVAMQPDAFCGTFVEVGKCCWRYAEQSSEGVRVLACILCFSSNIVDQLTRTSCLWYWCRETWRSQHFHFGNIMGHVLHHHDSAHYSSPSQSRIWLHNHEWVYFACSK